MKNYRYVLMATVVLSSCAAQPGRPVMGEAQYKGFALSSVTGEQCALTGMLDVDLAAANSVMLEAQAAAFEYDPARMEIERRQAAIDLQRGDGVTEPVCNALAYEVMRTLAVHRIEDQSALQHRRMTLQEMKQAHGAIP
ncbi:hypothetical protein IRZ53_21255 [Pseudomonas fulva]|uniref:hypothetical protein n=1 Tax=Pseudomonas fulva TaxID=47880 RepID=UPI0018AAD400|nr:hypothetical protein [Pseudomonas fulva]MBF8676953.1 hypothetical protein [Pseudomonas fulva]MBF8699316.1 hypothetical protein [Pseudomonas fulva]